MASDKKVLMSYADYLKHELTLLLTKLSENEAVAKKIVNNLDEESTMKLDNIIQTFKAEITSPSVFKVVRESNPPVTSQPLLTAVG
jgi:hypothetical protein